MKVLITIIVILATCYLVMAFYQVEKTVFSCYEVNSIKKGLEKTDWKNYCRLEGVDKGEKVSYEYNCNGKLDEGREKLREAVLMFAS